MITVKDFMEIINYQVTEGSEYGWDCYGPNAYSLSSWSGDNDSGYNVDIVYDTVNMQTYELTVCDYQNQRAYRWMNPDYFEAYKNTARRYTATQDQAWDDVKYTDLEVVEDFIEKAKAIVAGETYDIRIKIPLDIPDGDMFRLMARAHECDVTLNDYIGRVLAEAIANENSK
jgi:hypothetical protein